MNILILGAGLLGVSSAWYLKKLGHTVTVIDRQPSAAQETSFANGGQISVSHAEPWASPHTPMRALSWMGREDSPLLFRPRWDLPLFDWSLRFLRECTSARMERNIRDILALALYSRAELGRLRCETGMEYEHLERGILHIYTDQKEYASAISAANIMRRYGCDRKLVSADECLAIEPALASIRAQLVGGDFTQEDESGDAKIFTEKLAALCAKEGVIFRYNTSIVKLLESKKRISGVQIHADSRDEILTADAYVLALGSYSPLLVKPLGMRLPVYPAKGYSATIPLSAESIAPVVAMTDDAYKIVFSRLGQRLRVAGTAEFNGYNTELNTVRCQALMRRTNVLFPNLRPAAEPEFWTGLRPTTPTNVPLVGRSSLENLYFNTGHGTLGWTMACGSSKALADILSGRSPQVNLRPVQS